MRVLLRCVCLASALVQAAPVLAQNSEPPSDNDLKTAYCAGNIKSNIAAFQRMQPSAELQKAIDILRNQLSRIQSYAAAKGLNLDFDGGLLLAQVRGSKDYWSYYEQAQTCMGRCNPNAPVWTPQVDAQFQRCMEPCKAENPAYFRLATCQNLGWLPF